MKFSQFSDFQNIELEVAECISYLNGFLWSDSKKHQYFFIAKLNLILRSNIDIHLFLDVTKEYRSNKRFLTRVLSLCYILMIAGILRFRLGRFILKGISLEGSELYPVIIGGNNRLRFVDSSNNNALVVAKNSNSLLFTRNAMRAYCKASFSELDVIPGIIPINDRVYFEKQINGLSINRISLSDSQKVIVTHSLDSFFLRQQELTRTISISTYLRYKRSILERFEVNAASAKISDLFRLFIIISEKVQHTLVSANSQYVRHMAISIEAMFFWTMINSQLLTGSTLCIVMLNMIL